MDNIESLQTWIEWCLWISAIFTTLVPFTYLFSPWWKTSVGIVIMFRSFTFAFVIDLTLLFQYWVPTDILILFWANTVAFSMVALSSVSMVWVILRTNYRHRHLKELLNDNAVEGSHVEQ